MKAASDEAPAFDSFTDRTVRAARSLSDEDVLTLADSLHDLLRDRRGGDRAKRRYAVLLCGTEWRVVSGRGRIGHFEVWDEAFAFCARLSREAVEAGHEVEFLVQSDSGELLAV